MGSKIFLIIFIALLSCKSIESRPEFETKPVEPDPFKRAKDAAERGGGIFMQGRDNQNTTFSFATSNVLWRATLKSLDFLPLLNADYSGGIIITDWYTEDINSKNSIKLTIRFLGNDLKSDSLEIIAHRKTCEASGNCKITLLNKNFSQEIKDSIVNNARMLKIEDEKKKIK